MAATRWRPAESPVAASSDTTYSTWVVAAGVAEHVRMRLEFEAGAGGGTLEV
jgi:hypothetical protein